MPRIERKYCLISTSYLAGLFDIFILLHVWQIYVCFRDFYQWEHFVILTMRNLNLISVQSWTYLRNNKNKLKGTFTKSSPGRLRTERNHFKYVIDVYLNEFRELCYDVFRSCFHRLFKIIEFGL